MKKILTGTICLQAAREFVSCFKRFAALKKIPISGDWAELRHEGKELFGSERRWGLLLKGRCFNNFSTVDLVRVRATVEVAA